MKDNSTQQEVLIMTATGFASRQYNDRDTSDHSRNLPGKEKLKDACWNGLLNEMLPEVFLFKDPESVLYLWQVKEANQFLALEMSEYPKEVDRYLSIDPYQFMAVQEFN